MALLDIQRREIGQSEAASDNEALQSASFSFHTHSAEAKVGKALCVTQAVDRSMIVDAPRFAASDRVESLHDQLISDRPVDLDLTNFRGKCTREQSNSLFAVLDRVNAVRGQIADSLGSLFVTITEIRETGQLFPTDREAVTALSAQITSLATDGKKALEAIGRYLGATVNKAKREETAVKSLFDTARNVSAELVREFDVVENAIIEQAQYISTGQIQSKQGVVSVQSNPVAEQIVQHQAFGMLDAFPEIAPRRRNRAAEARAAVEAVVPEAAAASVAVDAPASLEESVPPIPARIQEEDSGNLTVERNVSETAAEAGTAVAIDERDITSVLDEGDVQQDQAASTMISGRSTEETVVTARSEPVAEPAPEVSFVGEVKPTLPVASNRGAVTGVGPTQPSRALLGAAPKKSLADLMPRPETVHARTEPVQEPVEALMESIGNDRMIQYQGIVDRVQELETQLWQACAAEQERSERSYMPSFLSSGTFFGKLFSGRPSETAANHIRRLKGSLEDARQDQQDQIKVIRESLAGAQYFDPSGESAPALLRDASIPVAKAGKLPTFAMMAEKISMLVNAQNEGAEEGHTLTVQEHDFPRSIVLVRRNEFGQEEGLMLQVSRDGMVRVAQREAGESRFSRLGKAWNDDALEIAKKFITTDQQIVTRIPRYKDFVVADPYAHHETVTRAIAARKAIGYGTTAQTRLFNLEVANSGH